jgi:uncharacterized protein (DUF1499 family)
MSLRGSIVTVIVAAIVVESAIWIWLVLAARKSQREPSDLGILGGTLRPCPRGHCVSSEAGTDESARVEPMPAGRSLDATREALRSAVAARGRQEGRPAVIAADEPGYMRAVFRSKLFGFADDFEARIDQAAGVVHVRSCSRVGSSDFGANRKRVEAIRVAYSNALAR